jgi:hypothetical protein
MLRLFVLYILLLFTVAHFAGNAAEKHIAKHSGETQTERAAWTITMNK